MLKQRGAVFYIFFFCGDGELFFLLLSLDCLFLHIISEEKFTYVIFFLFAHTNIIIILIRTHSNTHTHTRTGLETQPCMRRCCWECLARASSRHC